MHDVEEIWGRKGKASFSSTPSLPSTSSSPPAVVYARAPSFQTHYFSFRPNVTMPYSSLILRRRWARCPPHLHFPLTLLHPSLALLLFTAIRAPGTLLRLSTAISPVLFSNASGSPTRKRKAQFTSPLVVSFKRPSIPSRPQAQMGTNRMVRIPRHPPSLRMESRPTSKKQSLGMQSVDRNTRR